MYYIAFFFSLFLCQSWAFATEGPPDGQNRLWGLDTTLNSLPHDPYCEFTLEARSGEYKELTLLGQDLVIIYAKGGIHLIDLTTCEVINKVFIDTAYIDKLSGEDPDGRIKKINMAVHTETNVLALATFDEIFLFNANDLSHIRTFNSHLNGRDDFEENSYYTYYPFDISFSHDGSRIRLDRRVSPNPDIENIPISTIFDLEGNILLPVVDLTTKLTANHFFVNKDLNSDLTGYIDLHYYWKYGYSVLRTLSFSGETLDSISIPYKPEEISLSVGHADLRGVNSRNYILSNRSFGGVEYGSLKITRLAFDDTGKSIGSGTVIEVPIDFSQWSSIYTTDFSVSALPRDSSSKIQTMSYIFETDSTIIVQGTPKYGYQFVPNKNSAIYIPEHNSFFGNYQERRYQVFKTEKGIYTRSWLNEHYTSVHDSLSQLRYEGMSFSLIEKDTQPSTTSTRFLLRKPVDFIPVGARTFLKDGKEISASISRTNNPDFTILDVNKPNLNYNDLTIYLLEETGSYWEKYWHMDNRLSNVGTSPDATAENLISPNPHPIGLPIDIRRVTEEFSFDSVKAFATDGRECMVLNNDNQLVIAHNNPKAINLIFFSKGSPVYQQMILLAP